jgi:hypothetical protein
MKSQDSFRILCVGHKVDEVETSVIILLLLKSNA